MARARVPTVQELILSKKRKAKKEAQDEEQGEVKNEVNESREEGVFQYNAIADAIHQFRESYEKIESTKLERQSCKKCKKVAVENATAKANAEKEERLQRFWVEQQAVMANIIADAVKEAIAK